MVLRDIVVGDAIVANVVIKLVMTLHNHLEHMSKQGLKVLLDRNLLSGLKFIDSDFCEDCLFGKHHRALFLLLMISLEKFGDYKLKKKSNVFSYF